MVTERYEGATFVQRRFASREEMESVIRAVEGRGLRHRRLTKPKVCTIPRLFVSRPSEEIARRPIQDLVTVVSGANMLWSVGANVLGSYGQAVRKTVRAARRLSA